MSFIFDGTHIFLLDMHGGGQGFFGLWDRYQLQQILSNSFPKRFYSLKNLHANQECITVLVSHVLSNIRRFSAFVCLIFHLSFSGGCAVVSYCSFN